jgi:hypothetical protein
VRLLRGYVGDLDLAEALTEVGTEESTETRTKGQLTRKTTAKRTRSALAELERAEARAARLRSRLGLEPTSRARLMRDLSSAQYFGALTPMQRLDQAVDGELARRQEAIGSPDGAASTG